MPSSLSNRDAFPALLAGVIAPPSTYMVNGAAMARKKSTIALGARFVGAINLPPPRIRKERPNPDLDRIGSLVEADFSINGSSATVVHARYQRCDRALRAA